MQAIALVDAQGLRKQFFRKGRNEARFFDAVGPIDVQLERGRLVALTGRSGSGKSTLLNMLAGMLAPTEGTVKLDGCDLYQLPDAQLSQLRNQRMGVVPQGPCVLHSLSVVENVKLPHLLYRGDDGVEQRALQLLESLGIARLSDSRPRELSGGELRRMSIARALICNPDVVYADEPTGDLDDHNTQLVVGLLRKAADEGAAVLVATHEQVVSDAADAIIHLDVSGQGWRSAEESPAS